MIAGPPLIAVLPDQARAEERLLQLARPGGLVAFRPVLTLAELEAELLRAALGAGKCDPVAAPLALRLALREAARAATPKDSPFARLREEPGYARALEGLWAALAQGLSTPSELLAAARDLPEPAQERALALGGTLAAAQAELSRAHLSEPNSALRAAVDALGRGMALPAALCAAGALVFESILDWTPLRQRMVVALAARLPGGARVRVRLPYAAGRPELTEALDATLRAFEALGEEGAVARIDLELFDPGETGPLAPFLGRLFAPKADARPLLAPPVTLRSLAGPVQQAREAARACADLAANGVPLSELAITARTLGGGVAEELGSALERLDLPWRERRGRPALPSPPAQVALSLYDLLERNFPREPLAALLASPLLRLELGRQVKPHRAARHLREARARDDSRDDLAELEGGFAHKLARHAAQLRSKAAARGTPSHAADEVDRTSAAVTGLLAKVRALPARATLAEHGRALLALFEHLGVARAVAESAPGGAARSTRALSAAAARDLSALEAVQGACAELARAAASLGRAGQAFERAAFAEQLREALADKSLRPSGARGAAVQLIELRELSHRSFHTVVLVGLLDGELPARARPDPLLSDEDKRACNRALGKQVFRTPPSEDPLAAPSLLPARQAEEPLLFHLGLCAARESLLLLWPRADGQAREALRSPFVDEAVRALGLTPAEERALAAPLSPVPPASACRAAPEILARAALEVFAEPAWRASRPLPEAEGRALFSALIGSPLAPRLRRLARAASAERERLRSFALGGKPGRFSGGLQGEALQAALPALRFTADQPLSASQLEQHATCGFKHFARRLLRVPEPVDGGDELSPSGRGQLLHACLQRFFSRLDREGRLPLGKSSRAAELRTLFEEADAAIEEFAAGEPVGHAALFRVRRREVHKRLERLLETERREGSLPREHERAFGGPSEGALPPLSLRSPDGAEVVYLGGQLDRLDELGGGQGQLVLDYKSGAFPGVSKKLRIETLLNPEFQLPVYAAAVAQARPGRQIDAAYVSIGGARRTASLRATLAKEGLDADALLELEPTAREGLRQRVPPPLNLADRVWERVSAMRSGLFPIAPLSCEHCDLSPICRIVALPVEED